MDRGAIAHIFAIIRDLFILFRSFSGNEFFQDRNGERELALFASTSHRIARDN